MAKSSKKEEKDTKSAAKEGQEKQEDKTTHSAQKKVAEQKQPKTSSKSTRTETDLIGDLEIPADAYFGVHTVRAMDNFQISYVTINTIPHFIRGMVQVKKAAAMANRRLLVIAK